MTNGTLLYPALDPPTALDLLTEVRLADSGTLRSRGAIFHPQAAPAATGGRPVTADRLQKLQHAIRQLADDAGFPERTERGHRHFDRQCAALLLETMDIVPADAANEGVWSFLSLVVVPEVAPWRFPNLPDERALGKPRNTLRRLWWRAWRYGPDLDFAPEGLEPLGEDEHVQIEERTRLSGNRYVAQAIREGIWRAEASGLPVNRPPFVRQLVLRLSALRSHIALEALTSAQLAELIDGLVGPSIEAARDGF